MATKLTANELCPCCKGSGLDHAGEASCHVCGGSGHERTVTITKEGTGRNADYVLRGASGAETSIHRFAVLDMLGRLMRAGETVTVRVGEVMRRET